MKSSLSFLFLSAAAFTAVHAFLPAAPRVKTPTNFINLMHPTTRTQEDSRLYAVNVIIAGAPASGKGTQCELIKEKFGCVHLSTGDMLRAAVAAETEVGKAAKDFMDAGKLVPDDVIIGVVSICYTTN